MKFMLAALAATVAAAKHCADEVECSKPKVLSDAMMMSMKMKELAHEECVASGECQKQYKATSARQNCVNGQAGGYPCKDIDLLSFVPLADMGCNGGNDVWGWVDPDTGSEYALMGCTNGSGYVDVTDPENPRVLAFLPSTLNRSTSWRDIKVYKDTAFIVSEGRDHGVQVLDLKRLRTLGQNGRETIAPDFLYNEHGSSHNIVINEATGFAYSVGSTTCRGGLHVMDLNDPLNPSYAGCFSSDGYTHDAECVVYTGPDGRYTGREICFAYNENSLTLVDVTDKNNMQQISRVSYSGVAYSHQGWLTEDQAHLLLDDELDESSGSSGTNGRTRTLIWDVRNLENPVNTNNFVSTETSIDHNLYILNDRAYCANYEAGLRVLDTSRIATGTVEEVAYFDVRPQSTNVQFNGAWSTYPYFPSGNILISSIERGLFTVSYDDM